MKPREWCIYAMRDPRTGELRYVGKSVDYKRRTKDHLQDVRLRDQNHKTRWVRSLLDAGLTPIFEVLETGFGDWQAAERRWIVELRASGANLTNVSEGGRMARHGATNTPESRAKASAKLMGHPVSDEARAKISAAHKGRRLSPEHIAKCVPYLKKSWGRKLSPERRAKMMGHPVSAEARAKVSAAHRGKKLSPEHLAALRAGYAKPETYAKISAGNRGKKLSPEHLAAFRAGQSAYWARRKIGGTVE